MVSKTFNIVFYGVGGQGVLKASEIAAWAALYDGFHVKKSEVHGMSQRGGSVESHLRFGKNVFSPLIAEGMADIIVCFHKDEHSRLNHFLKKNGIDLISFLDKGYSLLEDKRLINTYLLGVLASFLPIKDTSWEKAIYAVFGNKSPEKNISAFLKGKEQGGKK